MKILLKSFSVFLALIVLSACKSDYEKYKDMKVEAARSSVIEMETPEGFRFDMDENAVNEKLKSFPKREIDGETYEEIKFGDDIYAVKFSHSYYKGKLCSYGIYFENKAYNLNKILDHYKTILKDYQFESLPVESLPKYLAAHDHYDRYGFIKGNLFIEILKDKSDSDYLGIICQNRPEAIKMERDYYESLNSASASTEVSYAEVKNSKWDGSVKQVEEYLKYTLRDPDSYESIEWSEVKRKSDGYYVRHKYRAKNGFGGYVVANQLFHLDFSGNVVDVKDLY